MVHHPKSSAPTAAISPLDLGAELISFIKYNLIKCGYYGNMNAGKERTNILLIV